MITRDQEIRDFIQQKVPSRFRAAGDLIATRLKLTTVQELRAALQAGKADGMMTIGPGKLNALRKALGLPQVIHVTRGQRIEALEQDTEVLVTLLGRAMSVIEDLTNLRPPCARLQVEIEDLVDDSREVLKP